MSDIFVGANSTRYGQVPTEVTKGAQELLDVLAQFGGAAADDIAAKILNTDIEAQNGDAIAEARGYFRCISAMIDAGLRSAWQDNGASGEAVSSEADMIAALAQHDGFPAEFIEEAPAEGNVAAEVAGYKKAIAAAVAAGFNAVWVDNRKQMFK